jgi:hypothetical protein
MKARLIRIALAAFAAGTVATLLTACAQGGASGDSAAVPSGSVTAYGVIDEGIAVTRK